MVKFHTDNKLRFSNSNFTGGDLFAFANERNDLLHQEHQHHLNVIGYGWNRLKMEDRQTLCKVAKV